LSAPPEPADTNAIYPLLEIDGVYYLLSKEVVVIGRGSDCDIILADSGVSRHHLSITIGQDAHIAKDMGSTNGVLVEGHSTSAATLISGNTIVVGHTYMVYWAPIQASNQIVGE
jgi:pSer/pThr/pTyr-binding forkhead associated (FHA) protein